MSPEVVRLNNASSAKGMKRQKQQKRPGGRGTCRRWHHKPLWDMLRLSKTVQTVRQNTYLPCTWYTFKGYFQAIFIACMAFFIASGAPCAGRAALRRSSMGTCGGRAARNTPRTPKYTLVNGNTRTLHVGVCCRCYRKEVPSDSLMMSSSIQGMRAVPIADTGRARLFRVGRLCPFIVDETNEEQTHAVLEHRAP